ncbi:MAG: helix-turn-helix domain-containing protein [Paeniglutamicibacter terrestris]|jgi:DNA-binding HxlR family transcriptional regulator|uniref:Helix-turn-helix transcriptional regulator n=1 Tax=Paeniglutamicibacter terrestris TaxID=2723403 RepID=A0ABX1G2E5_9MICC|nr:helix-turn-helix domain-containing protein [Paeniglutamicibacter terrestris]ASN38160.1 transcriptional regulator [Arthrobacter sp. 7749]NKG19637.1 helix-turn-helix transcriptional regulator [Paeniglutamicibacter terrestris]
MDTEQRAFDVMSPDCPSRSIMQRMGDKWTPLVFLALEAGPRRFSALRQDIGGVTPKVLTQTLRSLERDGLLTRTIYPEVPPRVEYELTELGATLLGPLEIVRDWAQGHAEKIIRARLNYDEINEG